MRGRSSPATASPPRPPPPQRLAAAADETPKPGELPNADFRMIATPLMALLAAAETARGLGLTPLILGDALEGEAAQVGTVLAGIARCVASHGQPLAPPAVLLSGGETTVTIGDRPGRARRAQHRVPARRSRSRSTARQASGPSPAIPTGSTAPRTPPARSSRPTRWPARAPNGLDSARGAGRARQLSPVRRHRRPDPHRADTDQRQRYPRHPDRVNRDEARHPTWPARPEIRRRRRTKIIATLGPASSTPEVLARLFQAGADVFRLNFSHGTHEDHAARFAMIRELEERFGRPIGILADVQGPKLRVGRFGGGRVHLQTGQSSAST